MALASSIKRFARCASLAALLALGVRADDPPAAACGFSAETLSDLTTFDPKILGDDTWDGLYFEPFVHGFGGACTDCSTRAMADDWRGYLGQVPGWDKVLLEHGDPKPLKKNAPSRLAAALAFVELARNLEPYATLDQSAKPTAMAPSDLLSRVQAARAATSGDKFLAQRYAFLELRTLFYQRSFAKVVALYDGTPALAGPSTDLAWRARYFVAGALSRDGKRGRANLELARIATGYQPLAGAAAQDFQPVEEADWKATLKLARDTRERTALWQLAGIKTDGVVAMEKIFELDPRSRLQALLLVRELVKAESNLASFDTSSDPAIVAAGRKSLERIERIAARIADAKGADRAWLAELVVGHLAAKRGDLVTARVHLQRAVAGASTNIAVATQAKASLALALAIDWKIDTAHEEELAHLMLEVDPKFSRRDLVRGHVRTALAKAYAAAGKIVDSEFLATGAGNWADVAFIKQMIARTSQAGSAFDRFVLEGVTKEKLQDELFARYLAQGDFVDAQRTLARKPVKLGTDPFVIHIVDCHDCDHEKYANAPWTEASFMTRVVELQKLAAGKGEAAAAAALELGNAMYNLTWFGNARSVLEGTRQATRDTRLAEHWYKRAYDLTKDRNLKTRAAYLAAKCELARLVDTADKADPIPMTDTLPVPTTWFPILRGMSESAYYKEILRECGNFRRWVSAKKK